MRKLIAVLFVGAFLYYAATAVQEFGTKLESMTENSTLGTIGCLNQ